MQKAPSELIVKLNKQYRKFHEEAQAQQLRLQTDPVAEQIDVAFKKYILPQLKKASAKGLASVEINRYQINMEFIQANLEAFKLYCKSNDIDVELIPQKNWNEIDKIEFSGWSTPIISTNEKHEATLTERVLALEERLKFIEREMKL